MILSELVANYYFWLISFAVCLTLLEISRRKRFHLGEYDLQSFFWLVFNGVIFGFILNAFFTLLVPGVFYSFSGIVAEHLRFLSIAALPFWSQVLILIVVQDFIEWCIHLSLHKIPALWEIHKLHHSIEHMNWLGNFRFHPLEIIIYKAVKYVPLLAIAPSYQVAFTVGMLGMLIGNLNHLSIPFHWRPAVLNYVFNSAGFHLWHHNASVKTVNYAIIFSLWDHLFGTAYAPKGQNPEMVGLPTGTVYPKSLILRLVFPFMIHRKGA